MTSVQGTSILVVGLLAECSKDEPVRVHMHTCVCIRYLKQECLTISHQISVQVTNLKLLEHKQRLLVIICNLNQDDGKVRNLVLGALTLPSEGVSLYGSPFHVRIPLLQEALPN